MGFGQGLSGLKAASQNLDVIGNNIANSATVGFKASTIAFADVYATSRVGLGVQVASVDQRFTTGNLSITGNQFDMAIDGDKGFFRLVDSSGQVMYSRNGQFHADKNHNIVNAQGQQLTGYMATSTGTISGELGVVKVPVGNVDPKATSEIDLRANFDSRSPVIDVTVTRHYGKIVLTPKDGPAGEQTFQFRNAGDGEVIANTTHNASIPDGTYKYKPGDDGEVTFAGGVPTPALDIDEALTAADGNSAPTNTFSGTGLIGDEAATSNLPDTSFVIESKGTAISITWQPEKPPAGKYTFGGVNFAVNADGGVTDAATKLKELGKAPGITAGVLEVTNPADFDPTRTENHTHSLPVTIYDSLGNPHQLTQYFVKTKGTTDSSQWKVFYEVGEGLAVSPASSDLVFNKAGVLTSPAAGHRVTVLIDGIGVNPNTSPAEEIDLRVNYTGSTQFGGEFSPSFTQNGYSTGEYSSMEIASNGDILANYTNGETKIMGAIALADFNNLNGLRPIGGNAWIETSASGPALLGRPGANGLATLRGQAVEESNVDMSEELVNMIIAQRTYQANAQTIKTQDQILQTLITLR